MGGHSGEQPSGLHFQLPQRSHQLTQRDSHNRGQFCVPLHAGGSPNPGWPTSSHCPALAGPVSPDRLSCPSQKECRASQQAVKQLLKARPRAAQQASLIHGSSDLQTRPLHPSLPPAWRQNLSSRPGHNWSHMDGNQQLPLSSGLCRKWASFSHSFPKGVQTRGKPPNLY